MSGDPWPRRTLKRLAAVDHIKRTAAYAAYVESARPPLDAPDPLDRTISKRQWEKIVQAWRAELRRADDANACQGMGERHHHILMRLPVSPVCCAPACRDAPDRSDAAS